MLAWCLQNDVPFLAWSPLASGFLVETFATVTMPKEDFRHRLPWAAEDHQRTLSALHQALEPHGGTRRAAIGWLLSQPNVHVILGARSADEARALAEYEPLTPEQAAALNQVQGLG